MYIGHFAIAYVLIRLAPGVPPIVPLIGVGFPDILWPILILIGVEKAELNPNSPLQKDVRFTSYPYSHSLVISLIISCIAGLILAFIISPIAGVIFVIASVSHWFLDAVVHLKDLPITGFRNGRKVGLGLWNYPRLTFIIEFIFYALVVLLVIPRAYILPLLILGIAGHMLNASSVFEFTKTNPFKSIKLYAIFCIIGFVMFSLIANYVLGSYIV
ncbi:MAG TPA: hypothetical protein VIO58_14575 [Candidatus Methanoperedens sp.]